MEVSPAVELRATDRELEAKRVVSAREIRAPRRAYREASREDHRPIPFDEPQALALVLLEQPAEDFVFAGAERLAAEPVG